MMSQYVYVPEQWHNFFLMVGGGAAALTGLLVVAMSPHLETIINDASLRHRALSILMGLGAAFIRCALVLMGGQNQQAVGLELLLICATVTAIGIHNLLRTSKHSLALHKSIFYRSIMTIICYTIEMVGAAIFIIGPSFGLYIAAIAMVCNFYFLFSGSWLLLVGISRDEHP